MLASLRKRMSATHFYGVPMNYGEAKDKFIEFKKQIMAAELPGIEESIFLWENSIHLTFGICALIDDVERAKAVELLQSCR